MIQWSNDPMIQWSNDPMIQWSNDPMIQWSNDPLYLNDAVGEKSRLWLSLTLKTILCQINVKASCDVIVRSCAEIRVTRLGNFSLLGRSFSFGSRLKITKVAHNFWLIFFRCKSNALILPKMVWATFWATFSQTHLVALTEIQRHSESPSPKGVLRSVYASSGFCVAPCHARLRDKIRTDPICVLRGIEWHGATRREKICKCPFNQHVPAVKVLFGQEIRSLLSPLRSGRLPTQNWSWIAHLSQLGPLRSQDFCSN
jgi:hypothetical protein